MADRIQRVGSRKERIDPMWSADEDERRLAIIRRASLGAREALAANAKSLIATKAPALSA